MTTAGSTSPEQRAAEPAAESTAPVDGLAIKLRSFGPLGVLAMLVIAALGPVLEPLAALLVLAWAHRSRTPWAALGFVRPRSWLATLAIGILFGGALKIVMKAMVMPLLGADPINWAFHHLVGNTAALPAMMLAVTIGAGFGEETVFRGFLFERLGRLFGRGAAATTAIVLLTSAWFGLVHYPGQGLPGAQQAFIVGLVYGTIFARTGRLWMLIIAHAAFDVVAVFIIYWDLEASVAHLIFR